MVNSGNSVHLAAGEVRDKAIRVAAHVFGVEEQAIEIAGGHARVSRAGFRHGQGCWNGGKGEGIGAPASVAVLGAIHPEHRSVSRGARTAGAAGSGNKGQGGKGKVGRAVHQK